MSLVTNSLNPMLMKKSVKPLVLITIVALFCNTADAQLRIPVINGLGNDVKKVIENYPSRFINLMGEKVAESTQSIEYNCNFKVNGAEETSITRYSAKKEVCSWQALMLTTESFDKAKQKFKSLYNQLNNLSVDIDNAKNLHLKGIYETPAEEKKFASVLFYFQPASDAVKKLKVEILMEFAEPMEWKVKVLVYDREREDNEKGKTVDE